MGRRAFHLFLVVSAGWVGCSSDRGTFGTEPQVFQDSDAGLDANFDAGCSGLVCSPDLRSVRDCYGNVVKECGADEGCGNGACVPPCDAAAINEGSVGCSFAIPGPNPYIDDSLGSCVAFIITNNWTSPATLHLDSKGRELPFDGAVWVPYVEDGIVKHKKLEGPIPPGGGAVVFVSNEDVTGTNKWVACPAGVKTVFEKDQSISGTGIGNALFARTDVPVSMYSIAPYGGARSVTPGGMVLLPTTSFRKNYVVVTAWGGKSDNFGAGLLPGRLTVPFQPGRSTLQIVATEDDTAVDIRPRVAIVGNRERGVEPGVANQVASYKLQRGEVLQFTQDNDLTGSALESDKPVGVFGGQTCMFLPSDMYACDSDNSQVPPISAWGHEYTVLPAPNRSTWVNQRASGKDPSVVRIVGAASGTTLVYEPARPEGAPDTLESGELRRFFANEPFVVRSQDAEHPFYVATAMTGGSASLTLMGDPEITTAAPTDQWLDAYRFFADYTYTFSAVYVTRRKRNGTFRDVTLDCAGPLTNWMPIADDYEWTYVELTRAAKSQTYPAGTCSDGPHYIHSEAPFSMNMWGISSYASYSYPGEWGSAPSRTSRYPYTEARGRSWVLRRRADDGLPSDSPVSRAKEIADPDGGAFVLAACRTTAANAVFIHYTGAIYIALRSAAARAEHRRSRTARRDVARQRPLRARRRPRAPRSSADRLGTDAHAAPLGAVRASFEGSSRHGPREGGPSRSP